MRAYLFVFYEDKPRGAISLPPSSEFETGMASFHEP